MDSLSTCLQKIGFCLSLAVVLMGFQVGQAQKVPIAFDSFHGYTGSEQYLKSVAQAYPEITELQVIGKSGFGRSIYVLVISNRKKGEALDRYVKLRNERKEAIDNVKPQENHQTKPGQWICGATHGNEYTGTEVCLYIIDQLVSAYGKDPEITDLVDNQTFYICPVVNPDGVFNSIERGIPQRTNSELIDDDQDGRVNEDGPEDMNGDGFISWFRYKDPKGRYVQDSVDQRIMIRLRENEKTDLERWSMVLEGIDNDNDGKVNEDGEAGFDLNRNFPEGWFTPDGYQGGTGKYPGSAPETRALEEFFVTHQNIHQAQFFHTSGGFTYRPMGSSSDESMHPDDIALYDYVFGKKYVELIGENLPQAWIFPDSLDHYKKLLESQTENRYAKKRGYEMPSGWVVSWNEKEDKRYSFGLQADWAYMQLGIVSLTTELFNFRKDLPGQQFEGDQAFVQYQRAALRYQEEKFGGKLFVNWKAFKQEELGNGEVGGWRTQFGSNNPFPGEMLEAIAETHWQYEKFRAQLMPRIKIREASAKVLEKMGKEKVLEVTLRVENVGALGTQLGKGAGLPLSRPDAVWLIGNRDQVDFLQGRPWQQLGNLAGTLKVPTLKAGKNQAEVKWIVLQKGDDPLTVVVSSLRGGTQAQQVIINN